MPGPLVRRTATWALLAALLAAATGCDDGSASPPRSTVAQTSTTYATVPARATTTTAAPPQDDTSAAGDDGDGDNTESTASQDPTAERLHEIESGDHLVGIGRAYDVPVDYIPAYNGWDDGLAHALVPGQTIRIPPADWTPDDEAGNDPAEGSAGSEPGSSSDERCGTYTIRAGDTPARVASAHDVSVAELDAANAGTPFYRGFVVGIEIVIPC